MADAVGPPKLKPFTKTRVALALEATPKPDDGLLGSPTRPFVDPTGQGPTSAIKGSEAEVVAAEEPTMFKRRAKKEALGEPRKRKPSEAVPGTAAAAAAFPGLLGVKKVKKVSGAPKQRMDGVSRVEQAVKVEALPEALKAIATIK